MKPAHKPKVPRISLKRISAQILQQLNLEKGLGYTIITLLLDPHGAIKEYLFEDRTRMVKPITFLLLTVAVATFVTIELILPKEGAATFQLLDNEQLASLPESFQKSIQWISENLPKYFNILVIGNIPAIALGTYLFFNNQNLNFAEHLVINIYISAFTLILYLFVIPVLFIHSSLAIISSFFTVVYTIFAYIKIFQVSFWRGIGGFFFVYLFQQLSYSILLLLVFLVATIVFF